MLGQYFLVCTYLMEEYTHAFKYKVHVRLVFVNGWTHFLGNLG